jgi:hypothetical protein
MIRHLLALAFTGTVALAADADLEAYLRVKKRLEEAKGDPAAAKKIAAGLAEAAQALAKRQAETDRLYSTEAGLVKALSQPRLRRSYADLLSVEAVDLAGLAEGQQAALKDLDGAEFTYVNNLQTREETWSAQAALLWPVVFKTGFVPKGDNFGVSILGLMPSVTLDRLTTNRVPKDAADLAAIKESETDDLTYRLGIWAAISTPLDVEWIARLNGGLQTDTSHRGRENFLEAELEPLWQAPGIPWLGLGYFAVPRAFTKPTFDPNDPDTYGDTYFAYQARLRLRYVYGAIEDDGAGREGASYARAGFTAEVNVEPLIWDRLGATVSWTYLATVHGQIGEEHYVTGGLRLLVWENAAQDRRVTLNATYSWGAQDYLGAEVEDLFKLSIGVLY